LRTKAGHRARFATVAAALVLLVILGGCGTSDSKASPPLPPSPPMTVRHCTSNFCAVSLAYRHNGKPRLQFDGDSVTAGASNDILAKWGDQYDIAINALVGTTTTIEAHSVRIESRLEPSVAVIELGTNDAICPSDPTNGLCGFPVSAGYVSKGVTGRLQTFADEFPKSTCVIFVVPDDHNPSWGPAQVKVIDAYERAHFAHLADWQAAYRPSYFDTPDQPHPNEKGRQALLSLIDHAMKGCPKT
jgi:hypothetical protein